MAGLLTTALPKVLGSSTGCKIAACVFIPNRKIWGKAQRTALSVPCRPSPFDYVNKDYTWLRSIMDRTTHRFDENSKIIVVEGPVAVGKTAFAKELASDLDMLHLGAADMNIHYCTPQGVDLRSFDEELPEDARTFDHVNFNCNPRHRLAGNFQIMMYIAKYSLYVDALAHLLNTGQGVVIERSPFSDYVFLEAMYKQKYISPGVRSVYHELRVATIPELMKPHLVIYLDANVKTVQSLIECRGLAYEKNGKAMTTPYLEEIERQYKTKYLREAETNSELLVYDWSGGGEVEVVVEDIERIDFNQYRHRTDPKLQDWRLPKEMDWADKRMIYTNHKHILMNTFAIPRLDVPELITNADDAYARDKVIYGHPAFQYEVGYTKGGTVGKSKMPKYTEYY